MLWVVLSVLAATFQTGRNALSRSLTGVLSPVAVSWARFAFNLPFALTLAAFFVWRHGWPRLTPAFFAFVLATALTQLVANVALIAAFRRATFAQSIVLHKLEVVIAAVLGALFFAERPTLFGWLGVVVCGAGTLLVNLAREPDPASASRRGLALRALTFDRGALLSLFSGVLLVITGFTLKDATEQFYLANPELAGRGLVAASHVLVHTVWIEVVVLSAVLLRSERRELAAARAGGVLGRMVAVGASAFAASLCWFWAYPLTLVAYAKAVGQIEGVLSVLLSLLVWGESQVWRQLPGLGLIGLGIALVLLG